MNYYIGSKRRFEMNSKEFGQNLASLLEKRGVSQSELAKRTGLTTAAISRYITGKREPRGFVVAQIAEAIGVTADELLGLPSSESSLSSAVSLVASNPRALSAEEREAIIRSLISLSEERL